MYGYIVPDKSTLRASDFVLYRSFYCGICCETGRLCGQLPRFTTNYDFAFLSALLHDCAQADIVIEEHGCVLNPKRKAILQSNPLLTRLVYANVMLCYKKADDGVRDGDGVKYKVVRRMLKKHVKKAIAECPELWARIERFDSEQTAIEQNNVASADRAADPFASLMRDLPALILGKPTSESLNGLCYNIGKFVYLMDALDDIADDAKSKRYNPFLAAFGGFKTRKEFIAAHEEDIRCTFNGMCVRAEQCCDALRLTQSGSLIRNIVKNGMRAKTDEIMASTAKLKNPRL